MRSVSVLLVSLFLCLAFTHTARAAANAEALARSAASENPTEASAAIAQLRALGPQGLRILFDTYRAEIQRQRDASIATAASAEWPRISAALDAVAQQRDAYSAGLYWYTDMEEAKRASRATGKPILSLRLLGKLSEEFSCANSRFFRAALYSNPAISDYLREHFILHWKTVRPAPRVTVDYGDGRKLERTITGNSIHYILDEQGRIVDALPGLYGPTAFLRELKQGEAVARQIIGQETAKRALVLGMTVIAYDPGVKEFEGVKMVTFDELLAQADYISLHLPKTKETTNMIGAEQFAKMKNGVRIVNCSRGGIITEEALYEALTHGKVAGAALDVFAEEPPTDWRLVKLENVIASPHTGAATKEAQARVGAEVAQKLIEFAKTIQPA